MNFATDVVDAAPRERLALVELTDDGRRREWSFGEVADRSARLAGTLRAHGVERGDAVMTLVGNRPEWVLTMVACFRLGAVALPCNEQLRAKDLRHRIAATDPRLIVADERNLGELSAAQPACRVLTVPDERMFEGADPAPPASVTGPTSRKPMPNRASAGRATARASSPGPIPTGAGKRTPRNVRASRGSARMWPRKSMTAEPSGSRHSTPMNPSAKPRARSAGSLNRIGLDTVR